MGKSIKNNPLLGLEDLNERYERAMGKYKLPKEVKERKPRPKKENSKRYEGKIWESTNGYMYTYDANLDPKPLHRVTVEKLLGRALRRDEKVGFADGNKLNCEPSNLTLLTPVSLTEITCSSCRIKLTAQGIPESSSKTDPQTPLPQIPRLEL